jgi:hypothetical protein
MKELYYLAGGFYSDWRARIIAGMGLKEGEYFSPQEHNDQRAALTFVRDDLAAIDHATAVIARFSADYACRGTAAEVGYAFAMGKPVLLIIEEPVPELFLVALSQRMFTSVDAFLEWHAGRKARGLPVVSRSQGRTGHVPDA